MFPIQTDLFNEYLGGTDIALSLKGVAELLEKNDVEKEADGGTEDDLEYLALSRSGTCLGTEDDRRALARGRNDLFIPVI